MSVRLRPALLLAVLLAPGCARVLDQEQLLPGARLGREPGRRAAMTWEVALADGAVLRGHRQVLTGARVALLYFGGNAEIVGPRSWFFRLAARAGTDGYAVNYRGFGPSDGTASFAAMAEDALAVYDAAAAGGRPVVVSGYSLGCAPALAVAAARPVAGVVLQAPPTSARETVAKMERSLPWHVRPFVRLRPSEEVRRWTPQPIDLAPRLTAPLLVIHGAADRVIPAKLGRKLYRAAGSAEKVFCEVPGAGHEELWTTGQAVSWPCLEAFLREVGG